MTPLKTLKMSPKSNIFGKKFWKIDFQLFLKIVSQIFFDFDQKRLILHSFSKLKKKKRKRKENLTK